MSTDDENFPPTPARGTVPVRLTAKAAVPTMRSLRPINAVFWPPRAGADRLSRNRTRRSYLVVFSTAAGIRRRGLGTCSAPMVTTVDRTRRRVSSGA